MNDRFKFRIWDKEQNKYLPLVSRGDDIDFWISLDNTGVYLVERDNNRDVAYFNDITEDVIVQFCTGLKDKNDKLIYDGDILRYPPKDQYEEKNYVACEVFFHNNDCCDSHIGFQMNRYRFQGALCGIANYGSKYKFIPKNTEKMEIIGNIYENKELLEEE